MNEYGILTLPSNKSTQTNHWEMGWSFKVGSEDIAIDGLRVYLAANQTVTAYLWGDSSSAIASVSITAIANEWSEGKFGSIITLEAGKTYTITCYNTSTRYMGSTNLATFNSKITYIASVYGSTRGSKPTNTESNWLYPFVDFVGASPPYKTSGNVVFALNNYAIGGDDSLHWTGDTPTGTSLKLYTKVNNGAYTEIASSGDRIQGLPSSGTCTLYIKAELATTDIYNTPKLTSITLKANDDKKAIVLSLAVPDLSPAIGPVTVSYDGLGGLQGIGGPSEAFEGEFITDLTWKGNQNEEEHVEISVDVTATLREIIYNNTQENEHVEITVNVASTLTDIHDL